MASPVGCRGVGALLPLAGSFSVGRARAATLARRRHFD